MGVKWPTVTFGDAPFEIIDGDRGTNYPKQADFSSWGYCLFLNAGNVTSTGFNFTDCAFITKEKDGILRKGKLNREDLILTTRGTVGNVAYFDGGVPFDHLRINSGMVILRPVTATILPRFLYLFLRSRVFQSQVEFLCTGSAQPQLPIRDIKRIELPLPPLDEQRAIAHILGTLDDKIELNRRMNETLEAMARALFKSWFVDFDPVRAKAQGQTPAGMDPATAALFPSEFEPSELGEIPKGWRAGSTRDLCVKVENGGTPKRSVPEYWTPATVPWLTSGEVRKRYTVTTENRISDEGLRQSSAKVWPAGTTIMAMYGATAGEVTLSAVQLSTNQACCGLIPRERYRCTVYFSLRSSQAHVAGLARGSAQQNLSQSLIAGHKVVVPPDAVARAFEGHCAALVDRAIANERENTALAELRDAVLPRLLSGELLVPEAEKAVEATA